MTIQITGKNLDAGNAFQTYAGDKIRAVLQKYLGREPDGHIRLERERGLFKTTCSVRLTSGLLLEAHGEGGDAYASVDAATHRLETRVRRHKGRIQEAFFCCSDGSAPSRCRSVRSCRQPRR